MSAAWKNRGEAGSRWLVRFIRWVALDVSIPAARVMLYPITAYFLLVRGPERRASRRFLRRAMGREPSLIDVARHIHTFAVSILDRVGFLTDRNPRPSVRVHGAHHVDEMIAAGRGVLLFGSHLGSFEVVRAVGLARKDLEVRILMDYQQNPQVTLLLESLNPRARASVIDASGEATSVLLAVHEALGRGGVVGILADRAHPGEGTVPAQLLGGRIALPTGPFRIAAVTTAPVLLIFGLLRPDGTYDVHFEPFADRITLRRSHRDADVGVWAARYAARLEHHIRQAPCNWFNFYDYWPDDADTR